MSMKVPFLLLNAGDTIYTSFGSFSTRTWRDFVSTREGVDNRYLPRDLTTGAYEVVLEASPRPPEEGGDEPAPEDELTLAISEAHSVLTTDDWLTQRMSVPRILSLVAASYPFPVRYPTSKSPAAIPVADGPDTHFRVPRAGCYIVTGESGTGKTHLLMKKLKPALEKEGSVAQYLIGEPDEGYAPASVDLLIRALARAFVAKEAFAVVDSLRMLTVFGEYLMSGGVPRDLFILMSHIDAMCAISGKTIFAVLNPMNIDPTVGSKMIPLIDGSTAGVIQTLGVRTANNRTFVNVNIYHREGRSGDGKIIPARRYTDNPRSHSDHTFTFA